MRRIELVDVCRLASEARGEIDRIFLHWSAGHYGQPYPDYHINIDKEGEIYTPVESLTEVLPHTWRQNTGSVGVALLCCAYATSNDLGPEPPTELQIECMAQIIAILCRELGLPIDYDHVRTHAEQANIDSYGPDTTWERWDLWFLHNGDEPGSGGDILRGKAIFYLERELQDFNCE
ncbi:hypothetical protein TcarDRAFT_1221 [Thermosinus carboxydivorans Nor1]|uniref:N-acetylmuramoyl-L-alanine amidase domain-containing protein n=1 Tax=Thermosinus carboxydivorans Nor1 TaxID=401526 RepID=A1HQX7_9FIRM|nr:N-acetylmuramoyl-L-alanine amidase [Thermosinus carboxydivorans]EAX47486.1 hypothetical protein TcarDRAFT_1221 [Thermosinus carboxydivorans Nor1]